LTYVDFVVYEALYQHKVFEPECLTDFPILQDLLDRFEALPAINIYIGLTECAHRALKRQRVTPKLINPKED
ncbi:unnamed protein product, partial [Allacma fusca]